MNFRRAEVWIAFIVLAVGLVFLSQSFPLSLTSELGPGPGFFPLSLSVILILLSFIYIYQTLSKKASEEAEGDKSDRQGLVQMSYTLGNMVLFLLLAPHIGFILASTLFLFLIIVRKYKWYVSVLISFGASVFLYWVFAAMLGVALPVNAFGW